MTLVDPVGGDNRIASITGLNISGTASNGLYDLTFHYAINYDDLQLATSPASPIIWTTDGDADTVFAAIATVVNAFGDVTGTRTGDVVLPQSESGANVTYRIGRNKPTTNYSMWFDNGTQPEFITDTQPQTANLGNAGNAWVTASLSTVPEPSAFLCLGLVGAVAVGFTAKQSTCHRPS